MDGNKIIVDGVEYVNIYTDDLDRGCFGGLRKDRHDVIFIRQKAN